MREKYLPETENKKAVSIFAQRKLGGLYHHAGATGDQIYDMRNMMPALGGGIKTRRPHRRYVISDDAESGARGLCVHGGHLYMARGTALYRITGVDSVEYIAALTNTDKTFATYGKGLFILPDRVYVDADGQCRPMAIDLADLAVQAEDTCLTADGLDWEAQGLREGDGVRLSCASAPQNDGAYRVASVQGHTLVLDHALPTDGSLTVSVSRWIPPLEYMCVVGNRLVGCARQTVYISEAGNPFNWCAAGHTGNAAPIEISTGGQGDFTGCIGWQGYGLFFKENGIYKLMGSGAYGYYLSETVAQGVADGEARSLCTQGGSVYYKGVDGVYRYDGSYPIRVGDGLGVYTRSTCAGSDGTYYYLAGSGEAEMPCLYTLETEHMAWYAADDSLRIRYMVTMRNKVYALDHRGSVWQLGNDWEPDHTGTSEESLRGKMSASVTLGYESCRLPDRHALSAQRCPTEANRLQKISLLVDATTDDHTRPTLTLRIAYDDEEAWTDIGHFTGPFAHRVLDCPLIPRACEHYRLQWETTGDWTIHRIYRRYEH